jgi:hypothetical protein
MPEPAVSGAAMRRRVVAAAVVLLALFLAGSW